MLKRIFQNIFNASNASRSSSLQKMLNSTPVTLEYLPQSGCVTPNAEIPRWLLCQSAELLIKENLRYPLYQETVPIINPQLMIDDQKDLMSKIKDSLNLSESDFEKYINPVIIRAASYMQLLPASESYHHSGRGGLFYHSLEVGYFSAQIMRGRDLYEMAEKISKRREKTIAKSSIRSQYISAAFIAGLLHDIGKPFADVVVVSASKPSGEFGRWYPTKQSMLDWAIKTNTPEITFKFVEARNKEHNHPGYISCAINAIISPEVKDFLGDDIYSVLFSALLGHDLSNELVSIMLKADQDSTTKDRKSRNLSDAGNHIYTPIEFYIVDALKRIALTESVNVEGGKIWHTDRGTFIVWGLIVENVLTILSENKLGKISHQEMLFHMLGRGLFLENDEGQPDWIIYPTLLRGAKLKCIKLSQPEIIFTGNLPPVTPILFKDPTQEPQTHLIESIASYLKKDDYELPLDIHQSDQVSSPEITIDISESKAEEKATLVTSKPAKSPIQNIGSILLRTAKTQQPISEAKKKTTTDFAKAVNESIEKKLTEAANKKPFTKNNLNTEASDQLDQPTTKPKLEKNQNTSQSLNEYIQELDVAEDLTDKQLRRRNISENLKVLLPKEKPLSAVNTKKRNIDISLLMPDADTKTSKRSDAKKELEAEKTETNIKVEQKVEINDSDYIGIPISELDESDLVVDSKKESIQILPSIKVVQPEIVQHQTAFMTYEDDPGIDYEYYQQHDDEYQETNRNLHQENLSIVAETKKEQLKFDENSSVADTSEKVDGISVFNKICGLHERVKVFYVFGNKYLILNTPSLSDIGIDHAEICNALRSGNIISGESLQIRGCDFLTITPQTITPSLITKMNPQVTNSKSRLEIELPEIHKAWKAAVSICTAGLYPKSNSQRDKYFAVRIESPQIKNILTNEVIHQLTDRNYFREISTPKKHLLLAEEKAWH